MWLGGSLLTLFEILDLTIILLFPKSQAVTGNSTLGVKEVSTTVETKTPITAWNEKQ